jgi:hypothetical protein
MSPGIVNTVAMRGSDRAGGLGRQHTTAAPISGKKIIHVSKCSMASS